MSEEMRALVCARRQSLLCLCRVPAAKPGKDSIELEVFGMAGVPEGAMPGAPPPDGAPPPPRGG
jgi:hypothetical protein